MRLIFNGKSPQYNYIRMGVSGNNLADKLEFVVANKQGELDLANFSAYLRIISSDKQYYEETRNLVIDYNKYENYIAIIYTLPQRITLQKKVDIQLVFENDSNIVWQTEVFNVTFDKQLSFGEIVMGIPTVTERFNELVAALESHISNKSNPHETNYSQVGAVPYSLTSLSQKDYSENLLTYVYDIHSNKGYSFALKNIIPKNNVTGVKGNAETQYRNGNVNITKANIGLDKVDNTADSEKIVAQAISDGSGNNIVNTYATKTALQAVDTKATNANNRANDAYSLAQGRARSVAFDTVAAMTSALKAASNTEYKIGDNLFIKEVGVPDYWISAVLSTNAGIYGYYEISILETQKVDLAPYQTKTDNTLNTTDKTVVGAINELNSNLDWSSYSGDAGGVGEALNSIEGILQGLPDRIIALENDNTTNKNNILALTNNYNTLSGLFSDFSTLKQTTGDDTTHSMSQKAVTDAINSAISNVDEKELVKAVEAPMPTPTETSPYIVYNDNKAYVRQAKVGDVIYAPSEDFKYYYILKYYTSRNTWNYRILWTKNPVTTCDGKVTTIKGTFKTTYNAYAKIITSYTDVYCTTQFSTLDSAIQALKSDSTVYSQTYGEAYYLNTSGLTTGNYELTSPIVKSNADNDVTYITDMQADFPNTTETSTANANGSVSGSISTLKDEYIELTRKDEVIDITVEKISNSIVQTTGTSTTKVMSQNAVTEAIDAAVGTAITTTLNTAV